MSTKSTTFNYPGFSPLPQHKHQAIERKRTELAPGVYAFVGYSTSNFAAIRSQNGYILIDTGDDINGVKVALKEISEIIPGQLQAIILTHSHPDHRGGGEFFLAGRTDVPIWGHINFGAEQKFCAGLAQICEFRAGKQFGVDIPDALYPINKLLPRFANFKTSSVLISPNKFVKENKETVIIDGVTLELHQLAGESTDHIVVWMPDQKVLFSGDHVYRSFPNIYPIRGGAYRDVEQWAKAVRRIIDFNPRAILFGHNEVPEKNEIMPLLKKYAEAIEYIYNETIKGMNQGKTPDELAATIQLPAPLRSEYFLGEFYGAIPWAVRSIYAHKLGWFDGNATNLVPLLPAEEAERIAQLAGGKNALIKVAEKAMQDEDYRWATRLADYLVQLGEKTVGTAIKADALEALSKIILPVAGKNYLLRSAIDLRAKKDPFAPSEKN